MTVRRETCIATAVLALIPVAIVSVCLGVLALAGRLLRPLALMALGVLLTAA